MDSIVLKAYTEVPDNSSYLSCVKNCPHMSEPMSGSTMGLLMILSTFQYGSPVQDPTYTNALSQASKAAYVQSGGQATQDKMMSKANDEARVIAKEIGINEKEAGILLGAAKVYRDKQIDVNGPKIYSVKTHVTVGQSHGALGLGLDF